jgi:PhnB protein
MADPLEALRLPDAPLAPRPAFAADLRRRIERELNPEEDTMPTTTATTTTTTLVPYVIVADAAAALDFYARAFGAVEVLRLEGADGRIGHAEVDLGGTRLMLADAYPEEGVVGPADLGGSPVLLHLEVPDADATFARAVAAGATVLRPVEDQFYGARSGQVVDPFGHRWAIQTITRAMTQDEMQRGLDELESE